MGATEKFCLRWNDFESNISVAFRELREEKDFFDVTLACDDSNQVQAHKVGIFIVFFNDFQEVPVLSIWILKDLELGSLSFLSLKKIC
jgi:hypothetical protein